MPPSTIKSKKRTRQSADRRLVTKRAKTNNGYKVTLDELDWKAVPMPDRLDDVEGFYGLDEIDGVNIEIDGGGRAEYKVCSLDWRAGKQVLTGVLGQWFSEGWQGCWKEQEREGERGESGGG